MWPVMTLTLLLQLTDDEQLYARQQDTVKEAKPEVPVPVQKDDKAPAAEWPIEVEAQA